MSHDTPDTLASFGDSQLWLAGARFALGALRRRWVAIVAVTLLFSGVGLAAGALLPRSYTAEARLLVRKNYVMPALASPRRAVPLGSEAPLQSAAEFVLSRQSLESIVERQHLVERWDRERPAILRAKDRAMEWLSGPVPAGEKAEVIADMLALRIRVIAQDEVVRVKATWPDQRTVVDVVNGAVDAFLEARRKIDVQTVADTHAILATFTEQARLRVDEELAALAQDGSRRRVARVRALASMSSAPSAADGPPAITDVERLRADIEAAEKVVADLERKHVESVTAIEARITERRSVLTERHPEIQALRRSLEQARVEPEVLDEARRHLENLVAEAGRFAAPAAVLPPIPAPTAAPAASPRVAAVGDEVGRSAGRRRDEAYGMLASGATDEVTERLALEELAAPSEAEDDVADYSRALLKSSIDSYQDLRARLANIQIELETAQAAFNYRYSVTAPARRPKDADSPSVPLVMAGAVLAGLMSGGVLALVRELRAQAVGSPSALLRHLEASMPEGSRA